MSAWLARSGYYIPQLLVSSLLSARSNAATRTASFPGRHRTCSRRGLIRSGLGSPDEAKNAQAAASVEVPPSKASGRAASPWNLAQLTAQILCITLPLGYGGIDALARIGGRSVMDLSQLEKGVLADVIEGLQLLYLLLVLRTSNTGSNFASSIQRSCCQQTPQALLLGCTGGPTCFIAVQLASFLSRRDKASDVDSILGVSSSAGVAAFLFASVVLAPILEEVIFRGILLKGLQATMPGPQAVLLSSLAFAGSHFSTSDQFPLMVLGVLLGCIFLASKDNIVSSVVAHAAYNVLVYCVHANVLE